MSKEEKEWGVIFTDDGLNELGEELKPYMTEGAIGLYLFCKQVDMSQQYLHIVVDYRGKDHPPFDLEFYVPHQYVKLIASVPERNKIGFL